MYSIPFCKNGVPCTAFFILKTVHNVQCLSLLWITCHRQHSSLLRKVRHVKHLSGVQYSYLLGKICMSASSVVRIPLSQEQYPICGISSFLLKHTPCKEVFSAVDNTLRHSVYYKQDVYCTVIMFSGIALHVQH
jgi:hypothetical protein